MIRPRPLEIELFAPPERLPFEEPPVPDTGELKAELEEEEARIGTAAGELEPVEHELTRSIHLFNDELDFSLNKTTIIGSDPKRSEIVIKEPGQRFISGRHCRITREPGGYYISDLGSANGTIINGHKIRTGAKSALMDGDRIRLGKTILLVEEVEE